MRSPATVVAVFMLLTSAGSAQRQQAPEPPLPRFDVASVKEDRTGEQPANNWQRSPGRINYQNSQLLQLIRAAWGDFSLRVEGAPGWVNTDRFDIDVRFPADTQGAQLTLMLRQLLIDRFQLKAHLEPRETSMYSLQTVIRDGKPEPTLKPGVPECAPGPSNPPAQCGRGVSADGYIDFGYYDMPTLARILTRLPVVGRPVVDNTGLSGGFAISLSFAPPSSVSTSGATPTPDLPSIFTALQEQLGLRLESTRGSVEVLVVDGVVRPTPD